MLIDGSATLLLCQESDIVRELTKNLLLATNVEISRLGAYDIGVDTECAALAEDGKVRAFTGDEQVASRASAFIFIIDSVCCRS